MSRAVAAALLVIVAIAPFRAEAPVLVAWLAVALADNLTRRVALRSVRIPWSVIPFLAWLCLSLTWSVLPGRTLEGAVKAAALALFACWIGVGRDLRGLVSVFSLAAKALMVLTWAVVVLLPASGRTQDLYQHGSIEGPFAHRNICAYVAVLALVTFAVQTAAATDNLTRVTYVAWCALAVVTIVGSHSSTAIVVVVTTALVAVVLRLAAAAPRWRMSVVAVVVAGGVTAAWSAVHHVATLTSSVGRDATLTGRTDIWSAVLAAIRERPSTGYGWNALWHPGTPVTEHIWAQGGFVFYHAHDGYLDTVIQVGLVGLLLLVVVVASASHRAMGLAMRQGDMLSAWPALVLVVLLTYNVTETVVAEHIGWVVLVMVVATLPRAGGAAGTSHQPESTRTRHSLRSA